MDYLSTAGLNKIIFSIIGGVFYPSLVLGLHGGSVFRVCPGRPGALRSPVAEFVDRAIAAGAGGRDSSLDADFWQY